VTDALTDLNQDVFGGAEAVTADSADAGAEGGVAAPQSPAEKPPP
jgi:hypothetical protein